MCDPMFSHSEGIRSAYVYITSYIYLPEIDTMARPCFIGQCLFNDNLSLRVCTTERSWSI